MLLVLGGWTALVVLPEAIGYTSVRRSSCRYGLVRRSCFVLLGIAATTLLSTRGANAPVF